MLLTVLRRKYLHAKEAKASKTVVVLYMPLNALLGLSVCSVNERLSYGQYMRNLSSSSLHSITFHLHAQEEHVFTCVMSCSYHVNQHHCMQYNMLGIDVLF